MQTPRVSRSSGRPADISSIRFSTSTRFGGSWRFIIAFAAVLIVYTAVNVALRRAAWDPYPFILLNLFLSMLAAVQVVKAHQPHEVIVAVPVAPPSSVEELRGACDDVICLSSPESFFAISQFYEDFAPVEDEQVCQVLSLLAPAT